jgi:sigma-B regulation protein RsbU (phosphoserine phosphatase)
MAVRAFVRTPPGAAIIFSLAIKLVLRGFAAALGTLPPAVAFVDRVATLVIAGAAGYLLVRGIAVAQRRLLWRVRRKLVISYIFIGFIPVILIVAFFLLGGLILFSSFSSYLVQSRLRGVADRAESIARTTVEEVRQFSRMDVAAVAAQRAQAAELEFEGASLAVLPMARPCEDAGTAATAPAAPQPPIAIAGPWDHVDAPAEVPRWVDCNGFTGLLLYQADASAIGALQLLVRALAFPDTTRPTFAVVVDLPVNEPVKRRLRAETGVDLASVQAFSGEAKPLVRVGTQFRGGDGRAGDAPADGGDTSSGLLFNGGTILEYRDWTSGSTGQILASLRLSIGEIYARISAAQFGESSIGSVLLVILVAIGVLFLIIEAAALIAGLALARSITGSMHELFTGTERVRRGDFTHKIAVKARDQLGELAASFNSMTASIEDLLRQSAEKKRLEEELRIAHEIQMSLLPQGPLKAPGLRVTALCVPAREVGGDYYDFLPLEGGRVGVLIADVAGKGTSAALYMAELKGLVLALSRVHTSPRALLVAANRLIAEHLDARSFITMTYAVVDVRQRTMTYARAGHTPLIYVPGGEGEERHARILAPDGLVLGLKIDDGATFERLLEEDTIPLAPGDLYLFFTDGISEAMNAADDCFGEQRLGRLLEANSRLPPDELRTRVLAEIAQFVGDVPQHDDMTMILLRVEETAATSTAGGSVIVAEVGR